MSATTKLHKWMMTAAVIGVISTVFVGLPENAHGAEIAVLANNNFSTTDTRLTLRQFFPNLRVDSTAVGDLVIFMPIPATLGRKILAVYVCYRTENARTFITSTDLSSFIVPGAPGLLFSDATDQASTTGTCYGALAPSGGVTVNGLVMLQLTLHFGAPGDGIFIGAIGVNFE
jgi:hypothetical protein